MWFDVVKRVSMTSGERQIPNLEADDLDVDEVGKSNVVSMFKQELTRMMIAEERTYGRSLATLDPQLATRDWAVDLE